MHTSGVYVLDPAEPDPPPLLLEDPCTEAIVGRTPLARGGWYVRAAGNRAAVLDDFLQSLYTRWNAGSLPTSTL